MKSARKDRDGFALTLFRPLQSADDAAKMTEIVDHILLLYATEYAGRK